MVVRYSIRYCVESKICQIRPCYWRGPHLVLRPIVSLLTHPFHHWGHESGVLQSAATNYSTSFPLTFGIWPHKKLYADVLIQRDLCGFLWWPLLRQSGRPIFLVSRVETRGGHRMPPPLYLSIKFFYYINKRGYATQRQVYLLLARASCASASSSSSPIRSHSSNYYS